MESGRQSSPFSVHTLAIAGTILAACGGSTMGGDLNPPPGPITGTMKTLVDVEPRIAISAINTPGDSGAVFKITQPGSYYLTGNLAGVSGKIGIQIAVAAGGAGVSIDLKGFDVAGAPGSLDGISATTSGMRNVSIRGGTVRGWGGDGIDVFNSQNNRLDDLRVQSNGGRGILGGPASMITGCTTMSNAMEGIRTFDGSTVANCVATSNTGDGIFAIFGSSVVGCTAAYNGGRGIFVDQAGTLSNCAALSNTGIGIVCTDSSSVMNCTAVQNTGGGISAGSASTLTGCTAVRNTLNGITTSTGATVTACSSTNNTGDGIRIGANSTVSRCSSASNQGDGIRTDGGCVILDNNCSSNNPVHSGIFTDGVGSRIEGNRVAGSTVGINVDGQFNLIIRNAARGNTTNFDIVANNRYGPIINITSTATPAVTGNSAASAVSSTDPWANFAYSP